MWRMLTARATTCGSSSPSTRRTVTGKRPLDAPLHLHRTGRPVVNDVRARFRFRDGLITDHRDSFSCRKLGAAGDRGPAGLVLGLPPLNQLVRRRARGDLAAFRAER